MTLLVTGAAGQLGSHLVDLARRDGDVEVVALTREQLDITSDAAVQDALATHRPHVVINSAAYTAVDAAETDEATATDVNGTAPGLLAAALARTGGRLIHVSTDYVFDGTATNPYVPGDQTGPRSAYGRSKLTGERAALAALPGRTHIVRAAWVHGGPGPNFVDTMRRLERERDTVDVVDDQIGSPTWARDLAAALLSLADAPEVPALLHYANTGRASWFDLAREVFRLAGADPDRVRPTDSSAFRRPAPRPAWSVLSTDAWVRAGLPPPRTWRAALAAAAADW